eukprot:scaffold199238_cov28-Tisochrysis_lutea.AAC.1
MAQVVAQVVAEAGRDRRSGCANNRVHPSTRARSASSTRCPSARLAGTFSLSPHTQGSRPTCPLRAYPPPPLSLSHGRCLAERGTNAW